MKYIIESGVDMFKLVRWYSDGTITAEEYFDAIDIYSKKVVEEELKHKSVKRAMLKKETEEALRSLERLRGELVEAKAVRDAAREEWKTWIDHENIRGPKKPWWKF